MKKVLFIATLLLVIVSCNKNQKAVKKLSGDWVATKYEFIDGGASLDYVDFFTEVKFSFDNCKLKDNEFCSTTISIIQLDGSTDFDTDIYTVKEKGTVLQLGNSSNDDLVIKELTSKRLVLTKTDNDGTLNLEFDKK